MKSRNHLCFLSLGLLCLSGCHHKTTTPEELQIRYAWWVGVLTAIASVGLVLIGFQRFRSQDRERGVTAILGGILLLTIGVPMALFDKVVVNDTGFYSRQGLWFIPTEHKIEYAKLSKVLLTSEKKRTRRGRTESTFFFDCNFKDGRVERVSLGNLMVDAHPEISAKLREHGVPIFTAPRSPK